MNLVARRTLVKLAAAALGALAVAAAPGARAADEAPNAMISRLTGEVLDTIKTDKNLQDGDINRIMSVVDAKIMPNVNFARMTASATGPAWRQATAEQRGRLQQEFKTLLVRTYAGALKQVKNQTVEVLPLRAQPSDNDVTVRTLIRGQGDPVQVDYRMERTPGQGAGWKIYDLNVVGVWLVDNYRPQFAQQLNAGGVDTLIKSLSERNRANSAS
ncbi:ABC transporter substrate-binding protein [Ottowia sp.]|uniref:MlaC/ttg2D family ABC transporter substrate-binding protein n=1 Tax=Ottowia sp. TaxID=1898956 RepID=UPI002CDF830D|nr:ABC transporter substrate-binding protein [Ottowia sp.]HOB67478.1 ABC transporter substrate-binding protein [Ottowia sp.]HPZ58053.1 ABC transporter substrate-binding protein [Ottowia sp.]HQD48320.1 ABC transporter substrate-binding protein [Ottowia sp.]